MINCQALKYVHKMLNNVNFAQGGQFWGKNGLTNPSTPFEFFIAMEYFNACTSFEGQLLAEEC